MVSVVLKATANLLGNWSGVKTVHILCCPESHYAPVSLRHNPPAPRGALHAWELTTICVLLKASTGPRGVRDPRAGVATFSSLAFNTIASSME